MGHAKFLRRVVLSTIITTVLYSCVVAIKRPIYSNRHSVSRRQSGNGYFFAQNISFGLMPPSPGSESGPWGIWTESSECSRTCGGGIAFQDRICMNVRADGRHSCIGASRRYFSCNVQDCPEGSRDFREEQCARFNTIAYEGKYYSWLPYHKGQNPCELNCMPRGDRFYTRLARKVIDGTLCRDDGSLDVCVDGVCMPVGCDMMLGSTAKDDQCMECGGDGTSCHIVKGVFTKDQFDVGYNDILLIPTGATSIYIKELKPTNNYLAIRNGDGVFYLNGNWRIDFPRDLKIAGTIFHYERKPHGSLAPESLRAKGPTVEPIYIVLLYQEPNLGVGYEYSIPVGVSTSKPESYSWSFGDFEECSQTCGGGVQYRPVRCMKNRHREIVEDGLCDLSLKPPINASCNTNPCPARWKIGDWSECSHPCGVGSQFRLVYCHQVKDENSVVLVPDAMCEEEKPLFMRTCNEITECEDWIMGEWSECNKSCGQGFRTREVKCQKDGNETISKSLCDLTLKPPDIEECVNSPCEGVEWILSDWSGCEGLCSPRMESRKAQCSNEDGVIFPNEVCDSNRLPELTRLCPISAICEPMWHASEWTECSVDCGHGVQTRVVFCGVWEENSVIKIDNNKCVVEKKFEEVQNCSSSSCDGVWFTGPWNRCSTPCGGGERTRKVLCFHENEVVNDSLCSSNDKPFEKETCNMMPCDGDEVMVFGGCKDNKFGCCPDGVTPAGFNFQGCPKMNVTSNMTCDDAEFGCCSDNFTLALGPFKKGCPSSVSCNDTTYGCCPDETNPALGDGFEGCLDVPSCFNSTYGCCPDGTTPALDDNFGGCNESDAIKVIEESSGEDCSLSEFGCCLDNLTSALGAEFEGCDEDLIITVPQNCSDSQFGCCEDNITVAQGPNMEGCMWDGGSGDGEISTNCSETTFGCCPDNKTIAKGFDNEECFDIDCDNSTYGCCSDNVSVALGPDFLGCENLTYCSDSEYGCCSDNITTALGPDEEGCNATEVICIDSEFGCCYDNVTAAGGPNFLGCDVDPCSNATYGCCPDNLTLATGPEDEGCDCINSTFGCCSDNVTYAGPDGCGCLFSEFGCCKDNITRALGLEFEGCDNISLLTTTTAPLTDTDSPECENTLFGCCPDHRTLALGPNLQGCCFGLKFGCCPDNLTAALGPGYLGCSCHTYPYGCCPDGITIAQGYRYHGCKCEHFQYGCCQDNITPATGPNFEGCKCTEMFYGCCPDGITPMVGPNEEGCGCASSHYGCCPDGKTAATSADLSGCPCDTLPYGCCPDGRTPARTSDHRDCQCDRQRYGCCLDGRTPALGPDFEGCPCESSRFGCCLDGKSVAQGPNLDGCPCITSQYGCCADGVTNARGSNMEGCPGKPQLHKISPEVCSLPNDPGPCRNYTVKWFFDVGYGGCSRFWYGGCDGNGNVFTTQEQCEETCVTPNGAGACLLPKVIGPCEGKHISFYYDLGSKQCESFTYSGCLGNNNRFTNKELCEHTCIMQEPMEPEDICNLQKSEGPCHRTTIQWYYNNAAKRCEQFYYGGCEGNMNRFETRAMCEKTCLPTMMKDVCHQPQETGKCYDFRERWYYDAELSQCFSFYYGGCDGNDNNFGSKSECEKRCGKDMSVTVSPVEDFKIEFCFLDQDVGPCSSYALHWFYNSVDGMCQEFQYSGCQGNGNRFKTRLECEAACKNSQDICRLPVVKGPCSGSFVQWYYDYAEDRCIEFAYSGCKGNANRFNSKEDCQLQCGKAVITTTTPAPVQAVDICTLPHKTGSCSGYNPMWYYDSTENICKIFIYGGCQGNENRFEKRTACEQRCIRKSEDIPPFYPGTHAKSNNEDVCRLFVDPGPCSESHQRWFYDAQSQSCLPFVYQGCGGNKNRFKSRDICQRFCSGIKSTPTTSDEISNIPYPPATAASTTSTTEESVTCAPSNCANIQCTFGIEELLDLQGCSMCRCSNPCEAHSCVEGSRCSIDIVRTPHGGTRTEPVCRKINKSGECPSPYEEDFNSPLVLNRDCTNRCRDDADCRGEEKCCNNGCANICTKPEAVPATQPEAARILPALNITRGTIGRPSKLPCPAVGNPKPSVTWWRETTMLPLSSSRYEQLPNYTLLIKSVRYEDRGDYGCQAHNGIGPGASFTVTLIVEVFGPPNDFSRSQNTEPYQAKVPLSASVSLQDSAPNVGSTVQIDCLVHGPEPGPQVTWYFEGSQIHKTSRIDILLNNTLLVRDAITSDSGEYTCTAKHSESVASSSVTIHVEANSLEDPSCIDSTQFANCEMIVKAKYCTNKYYGKYCCASCKKAGQLYHWSAD